MHPRAFAIACDRDYFPALRALLNSLFVYHPEMPVFLFERNFGAREVEWIGRHPLKIELRPISHFPYHCPGLWEAKQQAMAECIGRARIVCLIDADIVLLSRIDDVFKSAEKGKIVAGCDAARAQYGEEYRVYSPHLVGQRGRDINSGIFCLDVQRHWDAVGLWAFSSNYGEYSPHRGYPLGLPGFGDQGLLNAIIVMLGKQDDCDILPHGVWHDFREPSAVRIVRRSKGGALVVEHTRLRERQRILHCVGYKWWWPDPEPYHVEGGDKIACFRHFAALELAPKPLRRAKPRK